MKADNDCYDCMRRMVHQVSEMAVRDKNDFADLLNKGMQALKDNFSTGDTTISISSKVLMAIMEKSGNRDPCLEMKERLA